MAWRFTLHGADGSEVDYPGYKAQVFDRIPESVTWPSVERGFYGVHVFTVHVNGKYAAHIREDFATRIAGLIFYSSNVIDFTYSPHNLRWGCAFTYWCRYT